MHRCTGLYRPMTAVVQPLQPQLITSSVLDPMASALCRQASRHRNAMAMLRSANNASVARCSMAATRMAESPALRLRIAQNASGRGLRTLPRWNRAAEPGAAEGVAPDSTGDGKNWGAGTDGRGATRTAGIVFFSSVVR